MSSSEAVPFVTTPRFRVAPKVGALALPAILLLGFGLRLATCLTQTHVLFYDETIQYFEQGHRLAFDSGIVPWEFDDGIRSWLLPGLIALLMQACAWFSDNPMLYVDLVRTACIVLSMVAVLIGFRSGERDSGRLGAIVTGGFCAIWFDLIYFAPAVMTEILAAHCAIAALYLGEGRSTTRRAFWVGALFGAAICLRYQYAPALLLAAIWQYRRRAKHWQWVFFGLTAVLLPFSGVLDAITWGGAFQSIWLNFARNSLQGMATAIGTQSAGYYVEYLTVALVPLPLFIGLAVVGAIRFPALGIAALATLVIHSLVPHKEVRFIYLTIAAMPILIGLGASRLLRLMEVRFGLRSMTVGAPVFLALGAVLSCYIGTGPLGGRWSQQRGMVDAFLAAHEAPDLCGLQVRDMPSWQSGGYTYLNRDVPLMFDPYVPEIHLKGAPFPLRFTVELQGGPVSQVHSPYSHVIAEAAHRPAGFVPVSCFPGDVRPDEPELCLFRRRSGCAESDPP